MNTTWTRGAPRLVVPVAGLVLLVAVGLAAWVSEDAFITLRTVDNWVTGHGLTWNPDERVQTYTHPLWMIVLAAAYAVTREPYYTTIVCGMAVTGAFYGILARLLSQGRAPAVVAAMACVASNAFVDYSTSGLENPLTNLLLASFVVAYLAPGRRAWLVSLLAALLVTTRHDNGIMVIPALAELVLTGGLRRSLLPVALGLSPVALWTGFSVFYYGFVFPNSAYAKLGHDIPMVDLVVQGLKYGRYTLVHDPVTALVIVTSLVAAVAWREKRRLCLAGGVVLHVAYTVRIGGDFMGGRFFVASFVLGLCILVSRRWANPRATGVVATAAVMLAGLLGAHQTVILGGPLHPDRRRFVDGIADERGFFFPGLGLMNVGWNPDGPQHPWRNWAKQDHAAGVTVGDRGNVGLYGYYVGPGVHIIDRLALGDALLARVPPRIGPRWRIGHLWRDLPAGYYESIRSGKNRIRHPELARYYDALRLVIAGPLWSRERLAAIVGLNLGRYDELVQHYVETGDRFQVPLRELSTPRDEGTRWDCDGCVLFNEQGVVVTLGEAAQARMVEATLDDNDFYEVSWLKGGQELAKVEVRPKRIAGRGLQNVRVTAPDAVMASGFDAIGIKPTRGDGRYSLGHLVLKAE